MTDTYDEKTGNEEFHEKQSFPDMKKNRFSERLKWIMKDASNVQFAKLCGITESTIRNYLTDKTSPTLSVLTSIADATGTPLAWLASGELAINCELNAESNLSHQSKENQEPVITKRSSASVSVDAEMLRKLIEAIDRLDRMRDRPLSPDKKAKIIALLYEYCEKKKVVNDESIAMMMDIAS